MVLALSILNVLFVVVVVLVLAAVLLVPGRGPFAAWGTQGDGRRRWLTFSRHGVYDPTDDEPRDEDAPTG